VRAAYHDARVVKQAVTDLGRLSRPARRSAEGDRAGLHAEEVQKATGIPLV
jgi:hypothetical protein